MKLENFARITGLDKVSGVMVRGELEIQLRDGGGVIKVASCGIDNGIIKLGRMAGEYPGNREDTKITYLEPEEIQTVSLEPR